MKNGLASTLLFFSLVTGFMAHAQSTPAAIQRLSISAFGGITGSYTGLEGSRNLDITAGADLSFRPFRGYYPSAEVRGSYPIDNGAIAGERNILGGIKVEKYYGKFHPYVDALYGRNKITFQGAGYPNADGTLLYLTSIANVFSVGGGVDIDLTPHFAAKFDGQFQRYETPVTSSGAVYAKAFTAGVVYRFDFNHHFHYDRKTGLVTNLPKESAPRAVPPPPPAAPDNTPPPDATTPPATDTTAPPPTTSAPAPDPSAAAPPAPDPNAPAPQPAPQPQPQ